MGLIPNPRTNWGQDPTTVPRIVPPLDEGYAAQGGTPGFRGYSLNSPWWLPNSCFGLQGVLEVSQAFCSMIYFRALNGCVVLAFPLSINSSLCMRFGTFSLLPGLLFANMLSFAQEPWAIRGHISWTTTNSRPGSPPIPPLLCSPSFTSSSLSFFPSSTFYIKIVF